jgi:hypothetical protein
VAALYLVVKDHDNESLIFHMAKSQSRVLKREAAKEGIDLESPRLSEGSQSSPSCITKLFITEQMDHKVASDLVAALGSLTSLISVKLVNQQKANGK